MRVQPVGYYRQAPKFKGQTENPIDRKTERNLSILSSVGASAGLGTVVAGITTCVMNKDVSHRYLKAGGLGLAAAAATLLLTLPSKLYDTKVNSFTREKEMEIYSKDKDVQAKLYDGLDEQAKDEDVPIKDKVENFAMMQMAKNGSAVMIKH